MKNILITAFTVMAVINLLADRFDRATFWLALVIINLHG